jgi:hypothetical protein
VTSEAGEGGAAPAEQLLTIWIQKTPPWVVQKRGCRRVGRVEHANVSYGFTVNVTGTVCVTVEPFTVEDAFMDTVKVPVGVEG